MCSSVFVETEAPPCLLFSRGSRGGYGELSVVSQRFYRWNFFFLRRIFTNLFYLVFSWRLGRHEIATKLWVFKDMTDYVILFMSPFALPALLATNWRLFLIASGSLLCLTACGVSIFNAWHLRKKGRMVDWRVIPVFLGMKIFLVPFNIGSIYYSMFKYASFFSTRHSRVPENVTTWPIIRKHMTGSV